MKKFIRYAMLMALAIVATVQLSACADKDQEAIDQVVKELREDKTFSSVEYNGENIEIVMEAEDPEFAAGLKALGAANIEGVMKNIMLEQMKQNGAFKDVDKEQLQSLINKNCGFDFVFKAGDEKMNIVLTADDLKDIVE